MSEGGGPDPVLSADPGIMMRSGEGLQNLGAQIDRLLTVFDGTVVSLQDRAFGCQGDLAESLHENVGGPILVIRDILHAFKDALAASGETIGAVGGVFSDANSNATDAVQQVPGGGSGGHGHH